MDEFSRMLKESKITFMTVAVAIAAVIGNIFNLESDVITFISFVVVAIIIGTLYVISPGLLKHADPTPEEQIRAEVQEKEERERAWWKKPYINLIGVGAFCFGALFSYFDIPLYLLALCFGIIGIIVEELRKKRKQTPTQLPPIQN